MRKTERAIVREINTLRDILAIRSFPIGGRITANTALKTLEWVIKGRTTAMSKHLKDSFLKKTSIDLSDE